MFDFDTDIIIQDQNVTDTGNTLTYDQILLYSEAKESDPVSPLDIVRTPFDNDALREKYYDELKTSDPAFDNITDAGALPNLSIAEVVSGDGTVSSSDEEGNQFIIIGALAGFGALLVISVGLIMMRRRQDRKEGHMPIDRQDPIYNQVYYDHGDGPRYSDVDPAEMPTSLVEIDNESRSMQTG